MLPNTPTRGHILPVRQMRAVLSADQYATTIFNSYVKLVDIARYAKTEPTEEDAENVECAVYALTTLYVPSPLLSFLPSGPWWLWPSGYGAPGQSLTGSRTGWIYGKRDVKPMD